MRVVGRNCRDKPDNDRKSYEKMGSAAPPPVNDRNAMMEGMMLQRKIATAKGRRYINGWQLL